MPSQLRRAVALGQLLALLIATTASSSTSLARAGVSFPTLQSALNYFLLFAVYGSLHFVRGGARSLSRPAWQYAALAALDVEANYLVVLAFRHTSLTSVTLLDCWSIPVALALTRVLSLAAYRRGHYIGCAMCVLGLAILVATDERSGRGGDCAGSALLRGDGAGSATLRGDVLVVLGATVYAACNVLQEHLLGDVAPTELLTMLGAFGLLWSLVQGLPLELPGLLAAHWTAAATAPWIAFGVAMFSFYSLVPFQLSWGGAAMLNLSLLSSDLWTALARLLFFGGFTAWSGAAFLLSFAFLAAGIVVYSASGDAKGTADQQARGEHQLPAYHAVQSTDDRMDTAAGKVLRPGAGGSEPATELSSTPTSFDAPSEWRLQQEPFKPLEREPSDQLR